MQIGSLNKNFIVRTKNNPWQWKTVFPGPVKPDVKFSIDGKIYAGGYTQVDGEYNKDLYVYDPSADDWKVTGMLPFYPKNGNYTAVIENRAYCLHMSNFWTTEFWEYNAYINKWTSRSASLGNDASLQFSGSLINDNQMLYFYYYKGGGPEAIWKYTPSSDTWQRITTLPTNFVVKPGALLLGQRILIAPIDKNFNNSTRTFEVWKYDLNNNSWTEGLFSANISRVTSSFSLSNRTWFLSDSDNYFMYDYDRTMWHTFHSKPEGVKGVPSYESSKGYGVKNNAFYEFTPPQD